MASWNTIKLSEIKPDRFDAEYFRKDCQDNIDILESTGSTTNLGKVFHYINRGSQPSYNENGTLKVLRSVNVGFMNFNETRQEYVTKDFFENSNRGKIQKDDVLITSTGVGTLGRTSIWYGKEKAYCDSHITILRNREIDPYLITVFLNTKYGIKQFNQNYRGSSGQIEIYPYDISKFVIPECIIQYQNEIGILLRKSFKLKEDSQNLYNESTELLDKELGLDTIEFEKPRSYTASFSEVISNNRTDSEYYQVHFRQIEEHLETLKTLSLGTLCNFIKGYEVGSSLYTENGPTFIRVSNFTKQGFSFGNSDKHISNSTYSFFKAYKPNIEDILLTKDGTVGMCYVVDEEVEGIISSGIVNLTLLDETIPKEYLALVINSKICQMKANRDCSGALISHWKPQDIRKMKIPLLDVDTMQQLNDLVVESKSALRQSQQLLEQAKQRVEELIENAAGVSNE